MGSDLYPDITNNGQVEPTAQPPAYDDDQVVASAPENSDLGEREVKSINDRYPSRGVHRCLLVATTVLSVVSYAMAKKTMLPNLLLRSVALITSSSIAADGYKENDTTLAM